MKFDENNFNHIIEQIRSIAKLGEHVTVDVHGGSIILEKEVKQQLIFLLRKLEKVLGVESWNEFQGQKTHNQ